MDTGKYWNGTFSYKLDTNGDGSISDSEILNSYFNGIPQRRGFSGGSAITANINYVGQTNAPLNRRMPWPGGKVDGGKITLAPFHAGFTATSPTLVGGSAYQRQGDPKSLDEILALHDQLMKSDPRKGRVSPNPRLYAALRASNTGLKSTDALYVSAKTHGMAMIRDAVLSTFTKDRLVAIVYCTRGESPKLISESSPMVTGPAAGPTGSLTSIANLTQLPDMIVPAGVTSKKMPVTISFLGTAFSEPRLLAYAYAYEQATKHRVSPSTTPPRRLP